MTASPSNASMSLDLESKKKNELMCWCGLMRMLKNLNRLQKIFATAAARDLPPSHQHFTEWREFEKVVTIVLKSCNRMIANITTRCVHRSKGVQILNVKT